MAQAVGGERRPLGHENAPRPARPCCGRAAATAPRSRAAHRSPWRDPQQRLVGGDRAGAAGAERHGRAGRRPPPATALRGQRRSNLLVRPLCRPARARSARCHERHGRRPVAAAQREAVAGGSESPIVAARSRRRLTRLRATVFGRALEPTMSDDFFSQNATAAWRTAADRPERMNTMTPAFFLTLRDAVHLQDDAQTRALVLLHRLAFQRRHGAGGVRRFVRGQCVAADARHAQPARTPELFQESLRRLIGCFSAPDEARPGHLRRGAGRLHRRRRSTSPPPATCASAAPTPSSPCRRSTSA